MTGSGSPSGSTPTATEELTAIVIRSARILELEVSPDAAEEIARRSRGTPRIANRILRRVRDVAEVRHQGSVTEQIAAEALELLEIDAQGLERFDRELLAAIADRFGGGPVGLSTLAVALGEEAETIEDVYEPFLLQLGFLQRTPRGRMITELGRALIGTSGPGANALTLFLGWRGARAVPGATAQTGELAPRVQRSLRASPSKSGAVASAMTSNQT